MAEVTPLGAGSTPHPMAPPPDGTLQIRGGVGGVAFQFEELLAGAAVLEGLHSQLQDIEREAEAVRQALLPYQADSYATGGNAIIAVGEGGREVGRVRDQLHRISSQVRASHRDYKDGEARAAMMRRLGIEFPEFGSASFGMRNVMEGVVGYLPETVALVLGLPSAIGTVFRATMGPATVKELVRELTNIQELSFLRPRPIAVFRGEAVTKVVDLSLAGLVGEVEDIGNSTRAEIGIMEVDNNGQRVWVVLVPGTQPGGEIGGSNPLDEGGNAEGMGYDSKYMSRAIAEALRQAGAESGDVVVGVGHSQGGIHVMNLGQDKGFLAQYNFKFAVTAGSPTGAITPEPGIGSLHLEHKDDLVPGFDGVPNADTPDRVTVTMTEAPRGLEPGEPLGFGPVHKLSNYQDGAKLIESSSDPSLMASTAALGGILGCSAVAKVTRFKLAREPRPSLPQVPAPSSIFKDARPSPSVLDDVATPPSVFKDAQAVPGPFADVPSMSRPAPAPASK